jgi:hypothetical protein
MLQTSTKLVGIELEYSDIKCSVAQDSLEKIFGYPFDNWINSYGSGKKEKLDYSKWNCVIDNTIINSDGSTCSMNYIQNGNLEPIMSKEDHLKYSKGIEVISPPTSDYKKLISEVKKIQSAMFENGATVSRYLDNCMHFHIDANNLTLEQIKNIPIKILPIQEKLDKLRAYEGILMPPYKKEDAEAFTKCNTVEELRDVYICKEKPGSYSINHYLNRRIIDIGPWIKKDFPNKTIEFRGYSMSRNIEYIEECLKLSLDIYEYLVNDTPLVDFENRVDWIDSLN